MADKKYNIDINVVKAKNHPNCVGMTVEAIDMDTGEVFAEEHFSFGWQGIHSGAYLEILRNWAIKRYLVEVTKEGRIPEDLIPVSGKKISLEVDSKEMAKEFKRMRRNVPKEILDASDK